MISTLLLNFVADSLVSLMVQGPLQERSHIYPQSDQIAAAARLPLLFGTRLHAGFLIALLGALILWFLFARTLWGFRLRAVGVGPGQPRSVAESTARKWAPWRSFFQRRWRDWPAGSRSAEYPEHYSRTCRLATASPGSRSLCSAGFIQSALSWRESCLERWKREPARCSATPASPPWRCTWSRQ